MQTVVYALFDNRDQALKTLSNVVRFGDAGEIHDATVHEGEFHLEDVTVAESSSKRFALAGSIVSGLAAAVLAALVTGGAHMLAIGIVTGVIAAVFGGLGGAIVGAVEARPELEQIVRRVPGGKVLVTVDVAKKRSAAELRRLLELEGGQDVGML